MLNVKSLSLSFCLIIILGLGCESGEQKAFRRECRDFELKTIPAIKDNWEDQLQKAIEEETNEKRWGSESLEYLYFADILQKSDKYSQLNINGEEFNPWRYDIVRYRDLPGYYSCVLIRSFNANNKFGQFGTFSIFFIKTRTRDWRIIDYELESY